MTDRAGGGPAAPGGTPSATPAATASVIVITMNRPTFVRTCLEHLARQTVSPLETMVVDASPGDETERLVLGEFPGVAYLRNPAGGGAMATSRNIGFARARGDVVAFLDDDAFAEPDWLECLLAPFEDPAVGAVGGRVLRGPPSSVAPTEIGRLRRDGTLTGYFDSDPGQVVEVDHVQGASMSFRRTVLEALGGIRDGYPGPCLREDTDLCLRVGASGARVVFAPAAVVDHVAAPYARGKRFDVRYDYYAQRNHLVLLIRNFPLGDPILRRYLVASARLAARKVVQPLRGPGDRGRAGWPGSLRRSARGAVGAAATLAGTGSGMAAALVERRRDRQRGVAGPRRRWR